MRRTITRLWLTLDEAKTRLKDARRERFEFLGYSFGLHRHWRDGKPYLGASPSPKSVARLRQNVRDHLKASHGRPWPLIQDELNSILRGWDNYFCYGTRWTTHRAIDSPRGVKRTEILRPAAQSAIAKRASLQP